MIAVLIYLNEIEMYNIIIYQDENKERWGYLHASLRHLVRLAQREASHARAAGGDGSQPPISDAAARLRMPAREVEGLKIREESSLSGARQAHTRSTY